MPFEPWRLPLQRTGPVKRERRKPFVAFDFETTRIPQHKDEPMRVDLRYLTAYADGYGINTPFHFSREVRTHEHLAHILAEHFFTRERSGTRYIAWNANRFDYRPIIEAIVQFCPQWVVVPYEAGNGPRGFRVTERDVCVGTARRGKATARLASWEILDGIAITGCQGMRLRKFLALFAPDLPKHELDHATAAFDSSDPSHVAYAERDSQGLYAAMCRVDTILRDLTGRGFQVTIGNLGIKFFQQHIPEGVCVWKPHKKLLDALREYGTRGGFTYTARQYRGPLWTYDRNQEYAAIMRDVPLPCGRCYTTDDYIPEKCGAYYCTIAYPGGAPVPFYCATIDARPHGSAFKSAVDGAVPVATFLFALEIETLKRHGWTVEVETGWYWEESFSMREMVDKNEALRGSCDGGPAGPIGTMVKMIGNHSFGKTLEQPREERIVICADDPSDDKKRYSYWRPSYVRDDDDPNYRCYWFTMVEEHEAEKLYHRPQIGATITAGARCDMYDLAMLNPAAFIKADTDSVAFTEPIWECEQALHPFRYGALKWETAGDEVIVLGKKGYFNCDTGKAKCKGLNTDRLTQADFERWLVTGEPPTQPQIQTLSWKRGVSLQSPQYRYQERKGTDYRKSAPATLLYPSPPGAASLCGLRTAPTGASCKPRGSSTGVTHPRRS